MARLSILMPCRDAADTLAEAVESLDSQRFRDFQVVAVDDGSTDATPDLLASWASRDSRVRVLRQEPLGIVAALQAAAAEARTELLGRMDADDIAHPDRFERQVALLDARSELAACGTGVRYFPRDLVRDGARRYERWLNGLVESEELERDLFVECPIAHPTLVLRASAFRRVGGYRDPGWPEDYDLLLRLWAGGHRLANVPEVLLRWREDGRRASRTDPRYSPDAFRRCKVQWLRRTLLTGQRAAVVWGAGPVGKRLARELLRQGTPVRAFVDIDPRKIGQEVHGAPVIDASDVEAHRGALVLGAVGSPGGRAAIRGELSARGWVELSDYVMVA